MELEKLFLTKQELPILYQTCFEIPIHPKLLDENIKINPDIARDLFPQAAEDWYNDLINYVKYENPENKEWINEVFLKEKPEILRVNDRQFLDVWEDNIHTSDNGLVTCFSINRNA